MERDHLEFNSRRSCVLSTKGAVACASPLASKVGADVLEKGGNAADAAISMAATLAVVEPTSTGAGGDAFCLFYNSETKHVEGLDGSGCAPQALSIERMRKDGFTPTNPVPMTHGHTVTVPGAVQAWLDTVEWYGSGKFTIEQLFKPAITIATDGFALPQITSHFWKKAEVLMKDPRNLSGSTFLIDGHAPRWGEVFRNADIAKTLKKIAVEGRAGFYEGAVAEAIVNSAQRYGGVISLDDLRNHTTRNIKPISMQYGDVELWEVPPASQGVIALQALNILKNFDLKQMNTADYLHHLIEAFRLAYVDGFRYIGDPEKADVPIEQLLSNVYGRTRASLINAQQSIPPKDLKCFDLDVGSDTTYLTAVDADGNACSFINSNFAGFGTGIVADGCGFTLQNRGALFSLDPDHPNALAPGKRPFHTIIPAMLTCAKTGELLACYGVMGGFMQPQGHVQVLLNMVLKGCDPQSALDLPRIFVGSQHELGNTTNVYTEEGIPDDVIEGLQKMGHEITGPVQGHARSLFGRGHVITRGAWWSSTSTISHDKNVLWTGAESRADGAAAIYY